MKIWSPYESMEESAGFCPEGRNVKLVMRHSIRQEIKEKAVIEAGEDAQLTSEGRKIARRFGRELGVNIGTVSSSCSQRCIDTCREIIGGFNENNALYKSPVYETMKLQNLQYKNIPGSGGLWAKQGPKGIVDYFANNMETLGFDHLIQSLDEFLALVFETGNEENKADVFCTHDFQIAMLSLLFYENSESLKDAAFITDWPLMLEGMFFWGKKDNFTIAWRGRAKNIKL